MAPGPSAVALMLAVAVAVAGCNSGGETSTASRPAKTAASAPRKRLERNPANAGKTVTVGAAGSQEQALLAEIYAQALRVEGFTTKVSSGRIDGYPAYTGSAAPGGKLVALGRTPFENTYQLAMTRKGAATAGNPTKISDLTSKDLIAAGPPGCARRPDCLHPVERAYGLRFKRLVATPRPYAAIDSGAAGVAFVRSTDAALATPKYVPLTDDRNAFPPRNATFLIRKARLRTLGPDVRTVIELVQAPLSVEVQRELNAQVAIDGKSPKEVASEYLKDAGLVR